MIYKEINVGKNDAKMYAYLLDENISYDTTRKWPCMIVLPGGGYLFTATKEGESVAVKFFAEGYNTFILRYNTRVKNRITREMNENFSYPDPSVELLEALHIIREHAEEWHIDTDHIYLNGYSAGAHVILTAILRGSEDYLIKRLSFTPAEGEFDVKGLVLGYPMISVKLMDPIFKAALFNRENLTEDDFRMLDMSQYLKGSTCPMFIWQTAEDTVVNPPELCRFVGKALETGIPVEFHLFEKGPHGLAMADDRYAKSENDINPAAAVWFEQALRWMKNHR